MRPNTQTEMLRTVQSYLRTMIECDYIARESWMIDLDAMMARLDQPAKAAIVPAVQPEQLSDADVMIYYKKTAPIEDLKFFIRHCGDDSIRQDARRLLAASIKPATDNLLLGNRKEFYRQLTSLQDYWRQRRNRQEQTARQTRVAA